MKTVIPLSIAALLLAACQAASAQSTTGALRFGAALVESTSGPSSSPGVTSTGEAPHRATEQTLDVPAPTRSELLDYFIATRHDAGIDARELRLFTLTYL